MSRPIAHYIITALDDKGAVSDRLTYVQNVRHVALGVSFAQNLQQPPEMRILIQGDPAVSFMMSYIRHSLDKKSPKDGEQECQKLRTILESTVNRIAKEFLGITRETKGRPRGTGERAAYRLYHERQPIRRVSRELCAENQQAGHSCDWKCFDKIKKSATNHFKHLRQELQSVLESTKKKSL
jgi:RNase P protein component